MNIVFVSRLIAPNKVRGEYQCGQDCKIFTFSIQFGIIQNRNRKYVSNWKVYNNRVATTSIFNVSAQDSGT